MKKILCLINLLILCNLYANGYYDYNLENTDIPEEYTGTYLPVEYELLLEKYQSHNKALREVKRNQYTVLFLTKEICRSDLGYTDGFAIKKEFVLKWQFLEDAGEKFILDENGFKYHKISDKPGDYIKISNYIMNILLNDFCNDDLKFQDDYLLIKNIQYKFRLEPNYTDKNISFGVFNGKYYIVIIDSDVLKFVGSEKSLFMSFEPNDEIFYECKINKRIN